MRRLPVALVPAAVGLLLAACVADRDTTSPRTAAPDSPSLSYSTTPACNSLIKTDAQAFFVTSEEYPDPVFADITLMANAYGAAPTHPDLATPFALKIFNHISAARRTARQKASATAAQAGKLAHDVAACTNLGALDATFAGNAIFTGVFAVRGGTGVPTDAALAKPEVFPRWGVESETLAWPTPAGYPRYLILGTPGAPATELGGEPASVAGFTGYDVASLPADLPKDGLRVGICVKTTLADVSGVNRLIHSGFVEANDPPTFCAGAPVASLSTSQWFASLGHRMTSVFTPKSAWAQERGPDLESFTGGGPSSWSPMVFGKIVGASVGTSFKVQPTNGSDAPKTLPTFVVHSATPGHALAGVAITLSVARNHGEPAGAFLTGTVTVLTDANGDATFSNVMVNKPGGYSLLATGKVSGIPTLQVISSKFNVKNH